MRRLLLALLFTLMLLPMLVTAQDFPPQVQKALDDLNTRLGLQLTLSDFNWRYSKNIYDDSSLGCPQPGQAYTQSQTPGYKVELDVKGLTWDYRVTNDLSRVTLCSPLATPTPTPLPTYPPPIYQPNIAAPNSTATPMVCAGAPTPRLIIGMRARVLPEIANIVRQSPGMSSGYLGEYPVGREIYVLDGPRCASDMAWWYVADTQSRLMGWTSEGQLGAYWLEPVVPPGYPTMTASPTATRAAFVIITPNGQPTSAAVFPTPLPPPNFRATATPSPAFPISSAVVCNVNLLPRLVVGASGRVTPGIPNNLRAGAGSSTAYVGEIPPGGIFTVLDGPRCASGVAWWQVNYNGLIGWTPEGQGSAYWVEPA